MKDIKISVIGLGYIGLPTAVFLASEGFKVSGFDINIPLIDSINNNTIYIEEREVKNMLIQALKSKKFFASKEILKSDIYIICVPTPIMYKNQKIEANTRAVFNACKFILPHLKDDDTVIIESTCPIGTTEKINPFKLIEIANKHPRVNILKPGSGVGGHCIAIDPLFLVSKYPHHANLISQARKSNNLKVDWIVKTVQNYAREKSNLLKNKPIIGCLGITYKENTNDIRQSPSLQIITKLMKNFETLVIEPNIQQYSNFNIVNFELAKDKVDFFIILVPHREFIELAKTKVFNNLDTLDFCGVLHDN